MVHVWDAQLRIHDWLRCGMSQRMELFSWLESCAWISRMRDTPGMPCTPCWASATSQGVLSNGNGRSVPEFYPSAYSTSREVLVTLYVRCPFSEWEDAAQSCFWSMSQLFTWGDWIVSVCRVLWYPEPKSPLRHGMFMSIVWAFSCTHW